MQIGLVREVIRRFYLKKRAKLYLIGFFSLIASAFEYLGIFLIFQFIIILINPENGYSIAISEFFKNNFNIDNFSQISLIIGISIAFVFILKNVYMYFFTNLNSKILQDLSVEITLKLIKDILYCNFVNANTLPSAEKQTIISKVNIVIWNFFVQYINLITNFAIIVMLTVFLFIKFTSPAIIAFCFISVLSFIEYKILRYKSNYQNKYFPAYFDALAKVTYRIINAGKEIRLNNKCAYFMESAKEKYKNVALLNRKDCTNSVFHIFFTEISIMCTFIVILLALYFTTDFNNQTVITALGTIIAIILRITPAVNRTQSSLYGINANEKIVKDVIDFDAKYNNTVEIEETTEILDFEKEIKLENVSFNYPNSSEGLQQINLNIKKGEFIGIIGCSGCFKTTLSLIIAGLIKPTSGNIYIDNAKLDITTINKWQNNISILSQDFSILNDDIFENLDEAIINKMELAQLNSNPMCLSYGQKQKVALAQKIMQNKKLLILDEATSSLDVITEEKINNVLFELKGKRTIIAIAHRLQILKHCDRIIYMDKGKIIDIDTFINLNKKYNEFAKIIKLSDFRL